MSHVTLGLHVSHNSSACLFIDGVLHSAVQEERLTRIKQFEGFPSESIRFLLKEANLTSSEVDSIAIAGESQYIENPFYVYCPKGTLWPRSSLSRLAATIKGRFGRLSVLDRFIYQDKGYKTYLYNELKSVGIEEMRKVYFFDHHLCHAASAYYPSGYDQAIVITQDGRGDFLSGSAFYASKEELKLLIKQSSSSSLAQLYAGVTKFLGFTPLKHEGKITGLAAFGKKTDLQDKIAELFYIKKSGAIERNETEVLRYSNYTDRERKLINASPNSYKNFTKFGISFQKWLEFNAAGLEPADVAFAIQTASENIVIESVLNIISFNSIEKPISICLAGGLFANVKINQRIRECSPLIENVFVQPAMGDEGLAIGAAILVNIKKNLVCNKLNHVYLGNVYSDNEIEQELKKWEHEYTFQKSDNIEKDVARLLEKRKIIGRFNGRMEFGPRALGNRSILIHPGDKDINDIVNKRLKRTEFMPFAPSVIDYRAKDYFMDYKPEHTAADWMTITYNVYPEKVEEIGAVVHIDNTARPQVVNSITNSSYYKIISEFNELTGVGCIVNTSFNMHEEPIVASPFDAMRAFDLGSIDCLAIGNFLVMPKEALKKTSEVHH